MASFNVRVGYLRVIKPVVGVMDCALINTVSPHCILTVENSSRLLRAMRFQNAS